MSSHAVAALNLLDGREVQLPGKSTGKVWAQDAAARAQAHATLALVEATEKVAEQQRIANLIALAQFSHVAENGDRFFTTLEGSAELRLAAYEALGLS